MERTRWNDDLPTYLEERFYTKDEIDLLLEKLSLQSGLLFNLSSPNSIIQSGDTNTFHTELTWSNGAGLEDKDIIYEVRQGETLLDLETVQTDIDGVAEYEYTGTGVGEVTVTAKYGSLLQETYGLKDVTFLDWGTDTQYKNWSYSSNLTRTRDTNETTLTQTDTSNTSVYRLDGFTSDTVFEFDLKLTDTTFVINLRDGSTSKGNILTNTDIPDSNYHHVKIATNDLTVRIWVDNTELTPVTLTGAWNRFYFNIRNGGSVKYKNFYYYPI